MHSCRTNYSYENTPKSYFEHAPQIFVVFFFLSQCSWAQPYHLIWPPPPTPPPTPPTPLVLQYTHEVNFMGPAVGTKRYGRVTLICSHYLFICEGHISKRVGSHFISFSMSTYYAPAEIAAVCNWSISQDLAIQRCLLFRWRSRREWFHLHARPYSADVLYYLVRHYTRYRPSLK